MNREDFADYRLPLSYPIYDRGIPLYLTDRQILRISARGRRRIKANAIPYSYEQLHHTGYRTNDPVRSPPWIALFGGEFGYTEYVFVVRFKMREQRDRFSEHLHELHTAITSKGS